MDILKTIEPKSDQLNADDLIGGRSITVRISKVEVMAGDQPVSLHFEGGVVKPYKPCKSMRRVLVYAWHTDVNLWVGRSLTLYCDPSIVYGGVAVGGIRISHMSNIDGEITMALTAKRGQRKPYSVLPLKISGATSCGNGPGQEPGMAAAEAASPGDFSNSLESPGSHIDLSALEAMGNEAADRGTESLKSFWGDLSPEEKKAAGGAAQLASWKRAAIEADKRPPREREPGEEG
jgi:hypothetical protein